MPDQSQLGEKPKEEKVLDELELNKETVKDLEPADENEDQVRGGAGFVITLISRMC